MSIDFVLKDIYRSRKTTFPYFCIMSLFSGLTTFMVNFFNSVNQNTFINELNTQVNVFTNQFYLSGSIDRVFSQFNNLIMFLIIISNFTLIIISTSSLISFKKEDISVMKALGCLPQRLVSFYLLEVLVLYIFSTIIGNIFGIISFLFFSYTINLLGFPLFLNLDFIIITAVFFIDFFGVYFVSGTKIRKISMQNVIKLFSKDIPYDLTIAKSTGQKLKFRFLKLRIAIKNSKRRRKEFRRYTVTITMIITIIFTLITGNLIISNSSSEWIKKSQNENILVIGHKHVINNYSVMYEMFSNPNEFIGKESIQFTRPEYLFNLSDILELEFYSGIENLDYRLVEFCDVEELDGYYNDYDPFALGEEDPSLGGRYPPPPSSFYTTVGQQRKGCYPFIGIDPERLNQDFEIQGRFFNDEDFYDNITIGDGLAYNFFDYAYIQSVRFTNLNHTFHISGTVIDSFYSGHAGYVSLGTFQEMFNFSGDQINIVCIKINPNLLNESDIAVFITQNLGQSYDYLKLNSVFNRNLTFIDSLNSYSAFTLIILLIALLSSIYNYQKSALAQKLKDYVIMRAIGAKFKVIKQILMWESFFILSISLILSFAFGLILNVLFVYPFAVLPSIQSPLIIILSIFLVLISSSYIQLGLLKKNFRYKVSNQLNKL
ncbi:MAG: hypothetical protein KGD73_06080 [Candidatus Lokiarchaeota archaeon]|nr:hypothetical protein [Candidatus Lokiarchaeota archaeon]